MAKRSRTDLAQDRKGLAAIYCRVSTDEQAIKGYSLPTQTEACMQFAREGGYCILDDWLLIDDGYSGTTLDRPGLRKVRQLVRDRAIQAVIVYDPDRLSRNLGHQLLLAEEMDQAEVHLLIVSHPLERGPEGWLFFQMRGALAEYERAKMQERLARGRIGRAKAKKPSPGRAPFGYRYITSDHDARYEIDDEEAALVRRIFQMCLDNRSLRYITRQLSDERIPTAEDRRGRTRKIAGYGVWTLSVVGDILRNEAYVGRMYYNRTRRTGKGRQIERRPREEWICIPVPPVVNEDTFQAVQQRLERNKALSKRRRKHEYLFLAGRLRCGRCGSPTSGHAQRSGKRSYRCTRSRWAAVRSEPCRGSLDAQGIESQVWGIVEDVLQDPVRVASELERRRQEGNSQESAFQHDLELLETALRKCDREEQRWAEAYAGDVISLDEFEEKRAGIEARRSALREATAEVDEKARLLDQMTHDCDILEAYCSRVRANLNGFTFPEKRHALEALNITATWHPEKPLTVAGSIPVTDDTASMSIQ